MMTELGARCVQSILVELVRSGSVWLTIGCYIVNVIGHAGPAFG
jgi:hypothetical protein